MIDVQALKTSIDLLSLASAHTALKRVASSGGGEWAGPCPFCGGEDRFRVQPQASGGGRWLCRQCGEGKWQDAIEFGRRLWPGLSFTQVCDLLAEGAGGVAYSLPTRHVHPGMNTPATIIETPAYRAPQTNWQAAARQALVLCERALWSDAGQPALDYLRRRGLYDETIRYWRLGWSQGMKIPFSPGRSPNGGQAQPGRAAAGVSPKAGEAQQGSAASAAPGNGAGQPTSSPVPPSPLERGQQESSSLPPSPKGRGVGGESFPLSSSETGPGVSSSSLPSPKGGGAGGEGSLWIPRGILIPCLALDEIWYLKIALLPGELIKCPTCSQQAAARKPCPKCGSVTKYRGVKGNRTAAIYGADELVGAQIALFVEGEFDAMIAWQELRDVLAVCTLGSAGNRPDLATWGPYLLPLELILAAYDADAAGQKGLQALQALSERVQQLALPPGVKDINDFVLQGGELWPWVKPVLE